MGLCFGKKVPIFKDHRTSRAVVAILHIELKVFPTTCLFEKLLCVFKPGFVVGRDEDLVVGELRLQDFEQRKAVGDVEPDKDIVEEKDFAGDALDMAFDQAEVDGEGDRREARFVEEEVRLGNLSLGILERDVNLGPRDGTVILVRPNLGED